MSDVRAFTVAPDDDGIRLDRWFKRHLPEASFNIVSRWARTGQLRIDGKRAAPGDRIEAGQVIRVPPAEPPADPKPKIVRPELSEDEIAFVNEIVIHRDPQAIVVNKPPGLAARTRYRVIDRAGNRTAWIELQPLTGRTHQLRVHMAAIGHPIVGDGKYGGQDAFLTGAISRKLHLHARRLRIDHPDSGQIDVTAELPAHFAETLAGLGFDPADGDLPLDEVKFAETPEGKRRALTAAAKSRRKERKGERRSRGRGNGG
ncbi:MAG TPA: RluA family pseudouridine synthase [Allosphingosinicella sp.]|nr:RluA family pseudouridine synthase [Allosphingosinicella sp.]